jgi:hypothetical protein
MTIQYYQLIIRILENCDRRKYYKIGMEENIETTQPSSYLQANFK